MSITHMTVAVDTELLTSAIKIATRQDCTLGQLVSRALETYVDENSTMKERRRQGRSAAEYSASGRYLRRAA
jgi:hypothetical protein